MDILQIILFEYLFGYIMQGLAFTLGIYAFNRQKIEPKKYLMVSAILIVISYLMRLLPISFGVHTILNLLLLFLLGIIFIKMPIYATIRSTLFVTILLLITEMANVFMMMSIMGQDRFESMMEIPINKALIGLPAAFGFALLILLSYFILTRTKKKKEN